MDIYDKLADALPAPRKAVMGFAQVMEKKLAANDHKGGWDGEDLCDLMAMLRDEVAELQERVEQFEAGELDDAEEFAEYVVEEAADVANFAMMIANRVVLEVK